MLGADEGVRRLVVLRRTFCLSVCLSVVLYNFKDHGDQVYLVPSNYCNLAVIFRWAVLVAYSACQTSLLRWHLTV